MSNAKMINTYFPKQVIIYNITTFRLTYLDPIADSGSYLFVFDKLDMNSEYDSKI